MGFPTTAIENALQAWVTTATGFDNAHVQWAGPNVTRPSDGLPFVSLEIIDQVPLGAVPEVTQTDDLNRSAGQEIEIAHQQILDCGFRVQVFAPPARGLAPAVPTGAASSAAIAENIRLSGALSTIMAAFEAVGVSVYNLGKVRNVPAVIGTDFEGRAVLDARFYVANSVSEFTGYVATVSETGPLGDPLSQTKTITIPSDI